MDLKILKKNFCVAICNPTDVLKVRMQSNSIGYKNKGIAFAFYEIYKNEGFKGLYRVR